jgi:excisionase family DNA binding protein
MHRTKESYTSGEAARLCGLSLSTLKRWVLRGSLKAYRTPGGGIRILRADLMDFLREFKLPLHVLQPKSHPTVLVQVRSEAKRQALRKALQRWKGRFQVKEVESNLDLGYELGRIQPSFVVFEGSDAKEAQDRCADIRRTLAPLPVRIGVLSAAPLSPGDADAARPEAALVLQEDPAHMELFLCRLFGEIEGLEAIAPRAEAV